MILASFDIRDALPSYFLPYFESVGLSVHQNKPKIGFLDGGNASHFGFPIGMILAIFGLQVALILPTKFQINWPSSEKKCKIDFQDGDHGSHLGFPIRNEFSYF